jgi:hypothetical protein
LTKSIRRRRAEVRRHRPARGAGLKVRHRDCAKVNWLAGFKGEDWLQYGFYEAKVTPEKLTTLIGVKAQSFLIDGEVVIARDDRTPGAAGWSKGQYHFDASGSSVV